MGSAACTAGMCWGLPFGCAEGGYHRERVHVTLVQTDICDGHVKCESADVGSHGVGGDNSYIQFAFPAEFTPRET